MQEDDDPKHTSRLCQNYLIKKKRQAETYLVWNQLYRKIKVKQPTSASHVNIMLLQECRNERTEQYLMSLVKRTSLNCIAVITVRGGDFNELKI